MSEKLFNEELKEALKNKGIKQTWLADKMKIEKTNLNRKIRFNVFNESEKFHIKSLLNF